MRKRFLLIVTTLMLLVSSGFAQTPAENRKARESSGGAAGEDLVNELLLSEGIKISGPGTRNRSFQELLIRCDTGGGPVTNTAASADGSDPSVFTIIDRRHKIASLPRRRSAELSPNHILVVAVDAQNRLLGRVLIADPRILRAEGPGATGQLSGQVIYRASAEFLVPIPDDPAIAELIFYSPRWDGDGFKLRLLQKIQLPK